MIDLASMISLLSKVCHATAPTLALAQRASGTAGQAGNGGARRHLYGPSGV